MSDEEQEQSGEDTYGLDPQVIIKSLSDCDMTVNKRGYAYTRLNLDRKELRNVDAGILDYKEVQHINLSHNELATLGPLNALVNLVSVNAQYNSITTLSDFGSSLGNLHVLLLDFNQIEDFRNFNLKSVHTLTMASNLVTGFSDFANVDSAIEVLDLSKNIVTALDGIDSLSNLRVLNLHGNKLDCCNGIEGLLKLERLNLGDNQLTGADLASLKNLTALQHLTLAGNTLMYDDPNYTEAGLLFGVLALLPSLKTFDGKEITIVEREKAMTIRKAKATAARAAKAKAREEAEALEEAAEAEAATAAAEATLAANAPADADEAEEAEEEEEQEEQ